MTCDVNLQHEVLQKTLDEVTHSTTDGVANPCVICLEQAQEVGVAIPCKHGNFDFICLVSWLQQRRTCPLCQAHVTGVKYDFQSSKGPKIYCLPSLPEKQDSALNLPLSRRPSGFRLARPNRRGPALQHQFQQLDDPLSRRRHIYRQQLYSQRVGTNRLSQYRELTPQLFNRDENLVSRARNWIRRELQVFAFLDPDDQEFQVQEQQQQNECNNTNNAARRTRRARNAEFLLEYIIATLRTVDIKGSAGQAEELLQEFIGRNNARLFLHELQAWLRSPFNLLQDWDNAVQYDERAALSLPTVHRSECESHPANKGGAQTCIGRRQGNESRGTKRSRVRDGRSRSTRARRVKHTRTLYQPD
ncbi:RING finger protein [Emydomyces testavorans]|uniref:RING-type E3 ubiquitin transferase n=1 Tax=Emydomyces testavorans TaxID=2070801 RepID=A0AAF0IKW1_9EURO|nr:RING finger protein [Emydomyces testavorans]